MEKTSKIKSQIIFLFFFIVFCGSLVFLIFEMIPIQFNGESLPAPDLVGTLPLSSAIHKTKMVHDLRNHTLEIRDISQILWALQGLTHGLIKRTVPSAGALYPLEIFLIHNGSATLRKGCFSYISQGHKIRRVSSSFNQTKLLSAFNGEDYEAVSNVSTVFLILADYSRTTTKYGVNGVRYVHLEVGHAIQNFLLQLTSLNLSTNVITDFQTLIIRNFLNTSLHPLAVLPVGIERVVSTSLRFKQSNSGGKNEMTVEQAISERRSERNYQSGYIPLSVISNIIKDSTIFPYISESITQIDLRLAIGEINGLQAGSYKYLPDNNSLSQLSQGDLRPSLKETGSGQNCIELAQLDVVISVNTTWINQQFDPNLSQKEIMFHVGMLAQNIYLKCAAHKLGTVVIGALREPKALTHLLSIPDTHTPIYIMPIGLTPEYFEEETLFKLPLTDLARIVGLLSYVPLYFCLYLSLPGLRRRMTKNLRWMHCIFGVIPFLGVIFHFMIIHGHIRNLGVFLNINAYINVLFTVISEEFLLLIALFEVKITRSEIGLMLAYFLIVLGTIVAITGMIYAYKLIEKRKIARTIHKWTNFCLIGSMILHASLNGTIFASKPNIFLLLNILVISLYFMLYYYPDFIKTLIKRQELPQ